VRPGDARPDAGIAGVSALAALQRRLADLVEEEDRFQALASVAGADVGDLGRRLRGAVALFSFPDLVPLEESVAETESSASYRPGFLALREAPVILEALAGLDRPPDVLLCDGHGRAHPRRFGLACHIGVVLDRPTIGVAKSRYVGEHDPLPPERGRWVPLHDGDEVIGAVVRTRAGVRPVYVSVGHRISLETAVKVVLTTAYRFRLPEPLRRAHRLASATRA